MLRPNPYEAPEASLTLERVPRDSLELAAEWRKKAERLKLGVALPVIVAALVAGAVSALLHVSGYWSVVGSIDGYYVVNNASVAFAFFAPAAVVFVPGYAAFRNILRARRALFVRSATDRYIVDAEELMLVVRAVE